MKKIWIILFGFSVFILSACFPTGAPNNASDSAHLKASKDSAATETTPSFIDTKLEENLIVKADVTRADSGKLKSSSVTLQAFDEDSIIKEFLENKPIKDTYENNNELFPEYKEKYFEVSDGSYLSLDLGAIRYVDVYYDEREYDTVISGTSFFIRSDIKNVFQQTSLNNLSKDKAIDTVRTVASKAGISPLGEPEVFALDFKTLENEWEDYEGKHGAHPKKWEQTDEAYLVIFPVVYDNIAVTNKGYLSANNQIPAIGSRIMGVVHQDDLIYFTCRGIYEMEETIKENITPISVDMALEKVKNKYKDTLLTDPIHISHIALEYVPTVSSSEGIGYELIPAWVFTAQQETTYTDQKGTSTISADFTIIINAETGEEIRIGGEQ
ncbi:hypothetical protein MUB24_07610 [Lederbergia sp. NSJ-179]|uniref:hypothetical protein n=1 Tax=Lederbergia sp. NSJ-179 TaxID=2931402 RepID=UPI001FD2A013|nr:hypothetical protein [Lederbergia sp. NSJ-179]MCJ7840773.1 hypothetical protein [Lederbergia sp. NSJ-179]